MPWNAGHPAHPPSLRDGRGMTARQSAMPPLSYTTSTTAERQEEQDLGTARGASTASFRLRSPGEKTFQTFGDPVNCIWWQYFFVQLFLEVWWHQRCY